jgi:hypothetical protein
VLALRERSVSDLWREVQDLLSRLEVSVSDSQASTRSRLVAAARQLDLSGGDPYLASTAPNSDLLQAEPTAVFARSLHALRESALSAEKWSEDDLDEFADRLGLLVAGLRANAYGPHPARPVVVNDECRSQCEDQLELCHQPDPETGPHLDCFMVYAACLLQCSRSWS